MWILQNLEIKWENIHTIHKLICIYDFLINSAEMLFASLNYRCSDTLDRKAFQALEFGLFKKSDYKLQAIREGLWNL